MKILIWAEWQKLRRSSIILFTVIATVLIAAIVLFAGQSATIEGYYLNDAGWYMTMVQPWATMFVFSKDCAYYLCAVDYGIRQRIDDLYYIGNFYTERAPKINLIFWLC